MNLETNDLFNFITWAMLGGTASSNIKESMNDKFIYVNITVICEDGKGVSEL